MRCELRIDQHQLFAGRQRDKVGRAEPLPCLDTLAAHFQVIEEKQAPAAGS
jgi:hypothetical protein